MTHFLIHILFVKPYNHFKLIIFLLFSLVYLTQLYGQPYNYRFECFGYDQGLGGTPQCLLQDRQGFLWIGTWYGLYRYDGYEFELFEHDPNDSTTLSNENINCIVEDADGNLWVGTQNGLNKFNPFLGKSIRFFHNSANSTSLSNSYITSLLIDSEKILWIGTQLGGLNKMIINTDHTPDKSQISFQRFLFKSGDPHSISHNQINAILENPQTLNGDLLIGTANGLNIFNKMTEKCTRYLYEKGNSNSLPDNEIKCLYQDKEKFIWIGTNNGYISQLVQIPGSGISFNNYYFKTKGQITDIEEDESGNLWIGALHYGLFCFNKTTHTFFQVPAVFRKPGFLADDAVSTLLIDRNNIMWVGTRWGLNKYDPNDKMFKYYPIDAPEDLWIVSITGFCEGANGELWVATWGRGLFKIESMNNNPVNYMPQENRSGSLNSRWVTSILTDKKGITWVGTDDGISRYDPLSDSFVHFKKKFMEDDSYNPANQFIYDLFEDRKGNLWIATAGGIIKFDFERKHLTNILNNTKGEINKIGFYIGVIYEDHLGKFWIGANGLYQFDPEKGSLKKHYSRIGNSNTSIDYMVFDLAEDRHGNLWVGTLDGLFCVQSNGITLRFSEKDGLPSNQVCGILEDDFGFLWIGTFEGLTQLDPIKKSFQSHQLQGKFLENVFGVKGYYKGKDGHLYLGQAQRFTFFKPGDIRHNLRIPPVVIKQIKLFNNPVKFDIPISDVGTVNFTHNNNMLTFDFVSLNFTNSSQNKYAYMLEGFNEDWIYCGNERYATFTNLNPGEYVFRVKASNNDGVWNETGASIVLIITPPWWASWWFRTLMIITILGIGYTVYRYRINKVREMERLRVQIASDLHDDIGSALTRIVVHSEIIGTTTEKNKVLRSSKQIGSMSREVITTLSDVVWSIDSRNDTIGDLIDRMRDFLETVFPAGSIHIDFQTKGLHFDQKVDQVLRQNIYLIFKEAVNNAAKHSGADEIRITLVNGDGKFKMEITDNGTGINVEEKQKGHHGIENMELRAKRINGELIIKNLNKGTSVKLIAKNI